jgi:hypothetical protein
MGKLVHHQINRRLTINGRRLSPNVMTVTVQCHFTPFAFGYSWVPFFKESDFGMIHTGEIFGDPSDFLGGHLAKVLGEHNIAMLDDNLHVVPPGEYGLIWTGYW